MSERKKPEWWDTDFDNPPCAEIYKMSNVNHGINISNDMFASIFFYFFISLACILYLQYRNMKMEQEYKQKLENRNKKIPANNNDILDNNQKVA